MCAALLCILSLTPYCSCFPRPLAAFVSFTGTPGKARHLNRCNDFIAHREAVAVTLSANRGQ